MEGSKLYVGNLNYDVTEDQLKELFAQHGEIKDIVIIKDKFTGRSKGFGFVEFATSESAQKAVDALNGEDLMGRDLRVNEARPKRDSRR